MRYVKSSGPVVALVLGEKNVLQLCLLSKHMCLANLKGQSKWLRERGHSFYTFTRRVQYSQKTRIG